MYLTVSGVCGLPRMVPELFSPGVLDMSERRLRGYSLRWAVLAKASFTLLLDIVSSIGRPFPRTSTSRFGMPALRMNMYVVSFMWLGATFP